MIAQSLRNEIASLAPSLESQQGISGQPRVHAAVIFPISERTVGSLTFGNLAERGINLAGLRCPQSNLLLLGQFGCSDQWQYATGELFRAAVGVGGQTFEHRL